MSTRILTASFLATISAVVGPGRISQAAAETGPVVLPAPGISQLGTSGSTISGSDVTVNAGLTQGIGTTAGASLTSTAAGSCVAQPLDGATAAGLISRDPSTGVTSYGDPGPGSWYLITCPGTTPSLVFSGAGGGQAAPQPLANPRVLAQQALASMHLSAPGIAMSPPTNFQVVNLADWLWIGSDIWKPVTATATAGPVSATATATPDRVVWAMGNGDEVSCTGPGTPYDPSKPVEAQHSDCSYVYRNSSAGQPGNKFTVTARIYWHVTWASQGVAGGGDLGQAPGDPATAVVEVDEIQSVNIPPR